MLTLTVYVYYSKGVFIFCLVHCWIINSPYIIVLPHRSQLPIMNYYNFL